MDRLLDPAVIRARRLRRWGAVGLALLVLVGGIAFAAGFFQPSVRRADVQIVTVERGPVEASIDVTGMVKPEVEVVLSAAVEARVVQVLKRPGEAVAEGESVVALDLGAAETAVRKLEESLQRKDNEQAQTRIALERELAALRGQAAVHELELRDFALRTARQRRLQERGLVAADEVAAAELDEQRTGIAQAQTAETMAIAERATEAQLAGLALERRILARDLEEARRTLQRAAMQAPRAGVVTWVIGEEGVTVAPGAAVARVADLRRFRVDASVPDLHARLLREGMAARLRVGRTELTGTVRRVQPAVTNGALTVEIALDAPDDAALRPNQRVDVSLFTDRRATALRLPRAPAFGAGGTTDVFVVRGGVAERVTVRFGLMGYTHLEVLDGVQAGDQLIASDLGTRTRHPRLRVIEG